VSEKVEFAITELPLKIELRNYLFGQEPISF